MQVLIPTSERAGHLTMLLKVTTSILPAIQRFALAAGWVAERIQTLSLDLTFYQKHWLGQMRSEELRKRENLVQMCPCHTFERLACG